MLLLFCSPADLFVVDVKVSVGNFCFYATAGFYLQCLLIGVVVVAYVFVFSYCVACAL